MSEINKTKWRAINIITGKPPEGIGRNWFRRLWGADIWINNIPVVKTIVLANITVWALLVIFKRGD